jgi:anti-anti-sigma regulatory factor
LSEVTYADSSILAELLRFHGEAERHGVRVALAIASKQFARLVQYAGLAQAFAIFDSADAARAFLEAGAA